MLRVALEVQNQGWVLIVIRGFAGEWQDQAAAFAPGLQQGLSGALLWCLPANWLQLVRQMVAAGAVILF